MTDATTGFVVGVIVAVLVIGGGYAFLSGTADDVESDVAAELDDEDDATPRPTPRPTPEPPVDLGSLSFAVFVEHVTPATSEIVEGMQTVGTDASELDIDALTSSSVDLWLVLGEEVEWLDDNPPESCYADLHATYSQAWASCMKHSTSSAMAPSTSMQT